MAIHLAVRLASLKQKDALMAGHWVCQTMKGSSRAVMMAVMMVVMLASLMLKDSQRAGH